MTTTFMLTLSGLLALTGIALLGWVVWFGFRDSAKQGLLTLFVPGYVLFYGWTRMSHPRRRWVVGGALVAFLAAGAIGLFSTAFEPQVALEEPTAAGDDPTLDEGWESFEDLEPPPAQ
jgi:hypothetical protein